MPSCHPTGRRYDNLLHVAYALEHDLRVSSVSVYRRGSTEPIYRTGLEQPQPYASAREALTRGARSPGQPLVWQDQHQQPGVGGDGYEVHLGDQSPSTAIPGTPLDVDVLRPDRRYLWVLDGGGQLPDR